MAIKKNAKNISIIVRNDYSLMVGGKLEKISFKHNIESVESNLNLSSNKKIVSHGNKH
jgi:hypothetical protein